MATELIHNRGRGPELIGTRITVYNLMPYFLDPTATEEYICKLYDLTPEQVAALRAYVFNHPDEVLAQHLKIEARIAKGNPPEVIEAAKQTHELLMRFRAWLDERKRANEAEAAAKRAAGIEPGEPAGVPSFREWVMQQKSQQAAGH